MMDLDRPNLPVRELRRALVAPRGPLGRIEVLDHCASTNTELVEAVRSEPELWPAPAVLATDDQRGGKGRTGRTGRTWVTAPNSSVTLSLFVRPLGVPAERWTWLPLIAGLAVRAALRGVAELPAVVKWPNDVLIASQEKVPDDGGFGQFRKICGILVELVPGGAVMGIGVNVHQRLDELPVTWSTSTDLEWWARQDGVEVGDSQGFAVPDGAPSRATILKAIVRETLARVELWERAGGDPVEAGLVEELSDALYNKGEQARAELVGGDVVIGEVLGIDGDGRLLLRTDAGEIEEIVAGDVTRAR